MNQILRKLFPFYFFAFVVFLASRTFADNDFWFHLKTGEYIVSNGDVPRTEIFSFTHQGIPLIAHGWLSDVIFYILYVWVDPRVLILLFALLTAIAIQITLTRSSAHPLLKGLTMLLGTLALLPNIGVRPRVFSLLLCGVFLRFLSTTIRDWKIWLLAPLMVLWVNLHGGFLLGFALIGLSIFGVILDALFKGEKLRESWPYIRTRLLVLSACVLAALVNPYGIRMYEHTIGVLRSPIYQHVVIDWLSPDFHQSELLPLTLLVLLTIAALAVSPKIPRPSEVLFFVAAFFSTLRMQRNAMLLVLVAMPLFATYAQCWWDAQSWRVSSTQPGGSQRKTFRPIYYLLLLPLVIFIPKLYKEVYVNPTQEKLGVPVHAVNYMNEQGLTGVTFTVPNVWGAYLIWALPSNPVFIDGRDVYPNDFVKEYVGVSQGRKDWRPSFDRYGVRIALVSRDSVLRLRLLESNEWREVFADSLAVVLVRG